MQSPKTPSHRISFASSFNTDNKDYRPPEMGNLVSRQLEPAATQRFGLMDEFLGLEEPTCSKCAKIVAYIEVIQSKGVVTSTDYPAFELHRNFKELEAESLGCVCCRLLRQALLLNQITIAGVANLRKCQDPILIELRSGKQLALRICIPNIKDSTATLSCATTRPPPCRQLAVNALDKSVCQTARGWLKECLGPKWEQPSLVQSNASHRQCAQRLTSRNPTRLLHILPSPNTEPLEQIEVQLEQGLESRVNYVALSYSWGQNTKTSKIIQSGKTTKRNYQSRQRPFPCAEFPATIRDAIAFTSRIGVEYIWIDSVCIIQKVDGDQGDGSKDLEREMPKMHEVYGNALFTLAVCSNDNAKSRMLALRSAWQYRRETCKLSNQYLTVIDPSLDNIRASSPLSKRGWTLQEERLSPRVLYWTGQGMYWSCIQMQRSEVEAEQKSATVLEQGESTYTGNYKHPQNFLWTCWSVPSGDALHRAWLDVVKSYCRRQLGEESDRYPAISGLAARYQYAQAGDEYLAGLWRKHFAEDLAWCVVAGQAKDEGLSLRSKAPLPSWSWVSLPFGTNILNNLDRPLIPAEDGDGVDKFKLIRILGSQSSEREQSSNPQYQDLNEANQRVLVGSKVERVRVRGLLRPFLRNDSKFRPWSKVALNQSRRQSQTLPRFTFSSAPEQPVHSIDPKSGYVMAYESGKKETVGQLDYRTDADRFASGKLDMMCLALGSAQCDSMMLLARSQQDDGSDSSRIAQDEYRRVGISYGFRKDFFDNTRAVEVTLV
ncbi:HET-domain-containing protein [Mytilinidion resinicola]|uniref:HET-domain-containing protein n=1 Tax=Mytilinidion resinicola TaxID=574789 RepID=A0A6A6Z8T1_9PEZI|nr:HET-domain-containing protein [Mytilinidion resinicola]KAF2816695.1 HET-domain-containing protein [Mytilinidion resinicola]